MGTLVLVATYFGLILGLEFVNHDVPGAQHYEALGIRAGWLAVAQVPLLILLAGKNNLIGVFVGASYEQLNVYHRWVSRGLFLLVFFHLCFQDYAWSIYGVMELEWSTDECIPTGFAAFIILAWMNLTTLAPFRSMAYEIFVIQHLITFFGFIIAIMFHLPSTAYYSRVYIFIPIGLYSFDRIIRSARYMYHNLHPGQARMDCLDNDATMIRVSSRHVKNWSSGAHVLLSIPRFGFGQSHPATILSTPTSHNGDLVFILKAHKGFTRRILRAASVPFTGLPKSEFISSAPRAHVAFIDGPYSSYHPNFTTFDTLILIAGGTGITFTLSILLDLAERAAAFQSQSFLPLRAIHFTWIIKRKSCLNWISDELASISQRLERAKIALTMRVFITCDDAFIEPSSDPMGNPTGCQCALEQDKVCSCGRTSFSSDEDEDNTRYRTKLARTTTVNSYPYRANPNMFSEKKNMPKFATTITNVAIISSPDSSAAKTLSSNMVYLCKGRPKLDAYSFFWPILDAAAGETAVAVCGPLSLSTQVRQSVARVSDERALCKGSGASGVRLWVEQFGM